MQTLSSLIQRGPAPASQSGLRPLSLAGVTALLLLPGLARANAPELFQADPALLNDFTASLPSHGSTGGYEYEIIQGLAIFEGDILLGNVDSNGNIVRKTSRRGLARTDAFGRWHDGIVPYIAPSTNSPIQQANIKLAIEHWMEHSTVTFVERNDDNADQYPHYLRFASSNSCASYVGMQGGEQSIMVSDGCTMGSIIHEVGHALGLFHEHTRSDRDNFVQIDWNQIISGKDINFMLQDIGTTVYGPYDYGSIMHFGEYFFSKSTQPTIVVPDGIEIGQRLALSDTDAATVDEMYATDLALLPPSKVDAGDALELGLTVLNQGSLGAHELQMVIRLADDTLWQGVSGDSRWECLVYGPELRCTRPTLTEFSESRFTVLAEPGSASTDDIKLLLTSRTADTDTTNNRYNDDGSLTIEPASDEGTPIPAGSPPDAITQQNETPDTSDKEADTQVSESPDTSTPDEEADTQVSESPDASTPDEEADTQVSESPDASTSAEAPTLQVSEIPVVSIPDLQAAVPVSEVPDAAVADVDVDVEPDAQVSEPPGTITLATGAANFGVAVSDTTAAAGAINISLFLALGALIGWRRLLPTGRQLKADRQKNSGPTTG